MLPLLIMMTLPLKLLLLMLIMTMMTPTVSENCDVTVANNDDSHVNAAVD